VSKWNRNSYIITSFEKGKINSKDFINDILLGPQKEILEQLKIFNDNYYYNTPELAKKVKPLTVTKGFRLSPGSSNTIKEMVQTHCLGWKKGTPIRNLFREPYGHYFRNIGDRYHRIDNSLWNMRNEGLSWQDNTIITDKLIENIQDEIKKQIENTNKQHKDMEVFCYFEQNKLEKSQSPLSVSEVSTNLTFYIKFSNQVMPIWHKDKFIENLDIPGNIWIKSEIHLRKYINHLLNQADQFDKINIDDEEINLDNTYYNDRNEQEILANNKSLRLKQEIWKQLKLEKDISVLELPNSLEIIFTFMGIMYTINKLRYRIPSTRVLGYWEYEYAQMHTGYDLAFPFISSHSGYVHDNSPIFAISDQLTTSTENIEKIVTPGTNNGKLHIQNAFKHVCGGSVGVKMAHTLASMDFNSFKVHFDNWKTYNITHSHPLNQLTHLFYGMPKERKSSFKTLITPDIQINQKKVWQMCMYDINKDKKITGYPDYILSDEIAYMPPLQAKLNRNPKMIEDDDGYKMDNPDYDPDELPFSIHELENEKRFIKYCNEPARLYEVPFSKSYQNGNGTFRTKRVKPLLRELFKRIIIKYDTINCETRKMCPLYTNIKRIMKDKFNTIHDDSEKRFNPNEKTGLSVKQKQMELEEWNSIFRDTSHQSR